jgi:sulfur carrier protein ThiS adenylyltransferase
LGCEQQITVRVNEREHELPPGTTLWMLRERFKPDADVAIHNGFPCSTDAALAEGDEVALIRRGETPPREELEGLMVARHGPGVHAAVKKARVAVAGCGGLGSAVAIALARTGVGALRLIDFDMVEPSNLNRQQFFIDQLGMLKTRALAENLARINPYVLVETRNERLTRETMAGAMEGCDVVCECFDDPAAKRDLTLAMRAERPETPLVTVSGIAGYGPAGRIGVRRVLGKVWLVGDRETAAAAGCGLLAPRVAVAAGMQANLALRLLLGENIEEDVEARP